MNRYYYKDQFKTDGKVLGPVTIEKLQQLYYWKEITEKCLVCIEGTEEWQSCLEVLKPKIQPPHKAFDFWESAKAPTRGLLCLLAIVLLTVIIGGGVWLLFFIGYNYADFEAPPLLKYSLFLIVSLICIVVVCNLDWESRDRVLGIFGAAFFIVGIPAVFFIYKSDDKPEPKRATNPWAGKKIISVEKVTTESRVKPSIGIIGGKKPRTGIVGTFERGSTKYKVTYEDNDGIIWIVTTNKDPTRD